MFDPQIEAALAAMDAEIERTAALLDELRQNNRQELARHRAFEAALITNLITQPQEATDVSESD